MSRQRSFDAAAGLLAAALAFGIAELTAGLLSANSLVVSVGNAVVDYAPLPLVEAGIDTLGSNDKPALLAAIVAISLVAGALLGSIARGRWFIAPVAFAAFGTAGALAGARDPASPGAVPIVVAAVAAIAGWWTFTRVLDVATLQLGIPLSRPTPWQHRTGDQPASEPPSEAPPPAAPVLRLADRRRFLGFAGTATAGAALSAFVGREVLGAGVDVETQRRSVTLPPSGLQPPPSAAEIAVRGQTPLVTPNDQFYRVDTALFRPRIDVGDWRLRVTGMVDRPLELTFQDLLDMATLEEIVTLTCVSNEVGGPLVGNAVWLGVPLTTLLDRAGRQEQATQIVGRSVDGFTAGFPTEVAVDGRPAMVAIGMNGEPLPADHGFPARLVVPGLYGYISATKWLKEIELTRLDLFDGYWIRRGWSKLAPIRTQSRIDVPRPGQIVAAGPQPIAGVAWAGNRSVDRVEVRVIPEDGDTDEGLTEWREARLGDRLSQSSWRQWVLDWDAPQGRYDVEVRATDGSGDTQTTTRRNPTPSGATGLHRISVSVEGA